MQLILYLVMVPVLGPGFCSTSPAMMRSTEITTGITVSSRHLMRTIPLTDNNQISLPGKLNMWQVLLRTNQSRGVFVAVNCRKMTDRHPA